MARPYRNKLILSVIALAVLAGGAAITQLGSSNEAKAQAAGGAPPPMPVPVVDVQEKPVQVWKEFSARMSAVDYVEIRPQVSGIIEKINFEDGQIVKAGDVLYEIDARPYAAAVAQARADLAAAKDNADIAQKELKRAEELMKTNAISKQVFDQRSNALKVNKSSIASADAKLQSAMVDLDHASIKAPISGRISRPEITVGNLVSSTNAPLLTTIVSNEGIYADFEVDEQTYLHFVRQGSAQTLEAEKAIPVRLILQGDDKPYEGMIKSFDNRINPSSGTVRVRATFANEDNSLLPGMFARAQIGSGGSDEKHLTVPEKAINTDQNKKFVYIVGEGNAATYREVTLGDIVGQDRIILSGLKVGDKVITDGLMKIRPGAPVDPKTPEQMEQMKAEAAKAQAAPAAAPEKKQSAPAKK